MNENKLNEKFKLNLASNNKIPQRYIQIKIIIFLTTRIVGSINRKAYIHTEINKIKIFRLLQNVFHSFGFIKTKHRLKATNPMEIQSA